MTFILGPKAIVQAAPISRGVLMYNQINGVLGMKNLERITFNTNIMGGRACIRGMRITVATILNLVANGMSTAEIIQEYPYLEVEDVQHSLRYAALLADESVYAFENFAA
jgi:uncharacterized protein (DUF433 family)